MSRCRTPSAVALVLAAAGLSGGLAMPAAMAALPPGIHHRVPRPAATTGPSTMPSPAGTATVMPTPTGLPSPPGPSRPAPAIPVRIAATLSQSTVIYGTQVTLSGSLLGRPRPGQAYLPVPGQRVAIYSSPGPSGPVATTTTDQDGSFRLPLPAEAATTVWTLVAGGALDARTATATLTETVRLPTAFSGFSVTLDQYGHLGYSGCLGLPAGAGAWGGNSVTIQYAAQPRGPWHALASAALTSTPCGHGGQEFSGRTTARLNLAYYRAYFPGGTPSYLASASQAVLAWKFADRITSFLVSPASTGQRGSLTVRGTLQYYRYGWHGYQGQTVLAILRPKGRSAWYWIRRLTTGPGGRFSVTLADPLGATWSAEYLGNSTHLATVAAMTYVPLTTR